MEEISIEKARPRLGDLVRDAQQHGVMTRITRNGKPAAVLVPVPGDAERYLAARARALAAAPPDGDVNAAFAALGRAKVLLGELAGRLDPDGGGSNG
jgi:prevent-host-death family protein